jgi:hypothetical protein
VQGEIDGERRARARAFSQPGREWEASRFLDSEARLPPRGARDQSGRRRDYAALAGLAGRTPEEYEHLAPGRRREARVEIDRQLAERRRSFSGEDGRRQGEERTVPERRRRSPGAPSDPDRGPAAEVMEDVRAVVEGRKRQLGIGEP